MPVKTPIIIAPFILPSMDDIKTEGDLNDYAEKNVDNFAF